MNERPIGVFDSGVGGLTVYRALERTLPPNQSLIYLGDTARVPYGTRSADTVTRYSLEAAGFFATHRVRLLVVACNTVSAVAMDPLAAALDVPVIGVIGPGARHAVGQTRSGRIGVIGTRATVNSGAYTRAIRELLPTAEVLSQACPLFVPLAEEGWAEDDVTRRVAQRYLAPLIEANIDTLVLGCTHYPLLREILGAVMGPSVTLIDSAEAVAAEVCDRLNPGRDASAVPQVANAARTEPHFFVTDAPGPFQGVAERFLGRPIGRLEQVALAGD